MSTLMQGAIERMKSQIVACLAYAAGEADAVAAARLPGSLAERLRLTLIDLDHLQRLDAQRRSRERLDGE